MIAPGNHNFEKFAALCNTPGGSQELRRFWQVPFNKALCCVSFGSPGWRPLRLAVLNQKCVPSNEIHPLSQPVRAASSPRGGAKCGFAAGGRLRASPTVGAAKTGSTYHYRSTLPQPRFARQLPQRGSQGCFAPERRRGALRKPGDGASNIVSIPSVQKFFKQGEKSICKSPIPGYNGENIFEAGIPYDYCH